ncbi:MAG: 30S ribosomal protein S20 [Myxococcota bacterium]|nr:30S ribosomal protein S20 [Myxococcota bacterium]
MANHKSAAKRARQDLKRRDRNRTVRSAVRTQIKALRQAIEAGEKDTATARLRTTERSLRKAASKGVYKKTTASRTVSRLARAVAAI